MGTRSYIGVELPSGSIVAIYCHWDGYPEGVGDKLIHCYNDRAKVLELLRLGHISSLGVDIETTEAYHRDRGEEFHPARIMTLEEMSESWAEYCYKFTLEDRWEVKALGSSKPWHSVEAAIDSPEILYDEVEDNEEESE